MMISFRTWMVTCHSQEILTDEHSLDVTGRATYRVDHWGYMSSCLTFFGQDSRPWNKSYLWCYLEFHTVLFYFTTYTGYPCSNLLPSARQHPSYGDYLEVKREYYQNSSVLDCATQCSQSAAHLCEQFLQVKQIGFVTLRPLRCA